MNRSWGRAGAWLRRRAENVAVALLTVMFAAFIVQIVFRYLFNFPIGWTSELSAVTWLWLVMWTAGFVAKESEEIRFDIVTGAVGPRADRVMGIIVAISVVALYVAALPATYKYISFMKVEKSSYLHIRLDILFSAFGLYVLAIIVRYLRILWHLLRGKEAAEAGATTGNSPGP